MKVLGNGNTAQVVLWDTLEKYEVKDFRTFTVAMTEARRKFSNSNVSVVERLKGNSFLQKAEQAIINNDYCYIKALNNTFRG